MQCDLALFPELKHNKDFCPWDDSTQLIAATQGIDDVLDASFDPPSNDQDAINLFAEQQKCMMSMFSTKFQTTKGEALVRQCKHTHDA